MSRIKLKCGGKPRRKALFGSDGAIMAAATLAAAGISAGATAAAAKSQAKAVTESAKTQAQSIKDQTLNNNNLQKESLAFTRQQNQENRQQQQDIQTTLQMLAGQQNANDRMEANKMQVKYGGKPKKKLKSTPFYGGVNNLFKVTDGGGAIPVQTDENGYGLYELYGNDHEHYHKAQGGKHKTGVGIKFANGSVVEGEGNQNTNQGELMYITPDDAVFISKHNIAGYNPTKAVKAGVHPMEAFNTQETLKAINGLNDDGSRKRANLGAFNVVNDIANITQLPSNGTGGVAGGVAYAVKPVNESTSPVAKNGKHISIKRNKAYNGTSTFQQLINARRNGITTNNITPKSTSNWGNYAGATYSAIGNLAGAGITTLGNIYAGRKLGQAYMQAGNILADAYSQMKGIDLSEIKREDYEAPHTLAVVRSANTNINPQLERARRNSFAEMRDINKGTLSSAARQVRLASTNDRLAQRVNELYAAKENSDEQIKQGNAERITQTAQANADRDVQARKDYKDQRLAVMQYNNNIENSKIAGMAQARADALTQSKSVNSAAFESSMGAFGNALTSLASGYASTVDGLRKTIADRKNILIGADTENVVNYLVGNPGDIGNKQDAINKVLAWQNSPNAKLREYARQLKIAYNI